MKRGFTLVELSIVLVIIGLLAAGVMIAQSMISTANMQSQIRLLQQYEIATRNFYKMFKYLPGDLPGSLRTGYFPMSTQQTADGDGYLTIHEGQFSFSDLSAAQIIPDKYGYIPDGESNWFSGNPIPQAQWPGVYVPKLAKKGILGLDSQTIWGQNIDAVAGLSHCRYGAFIAEVHPTFTIAQGMGRNGYFSAVEAKAIDSKIDDGAAAKGNLIAENASSGSGSCGGILSSDPNYDYNLNQTGDRNCYIFYCFDSGLF